MNQRRIWTHHVPSRFLFDLEDWCFQRQKYHCFLHFSKIATTGAIFPVLRLQDVYNFLGGKTPKTWRPSHQPQQPPLSLRWFSGWKLQVQSGGGLSAGWKGEGQGIGLKPRSPHEGWESSNLFPADQPFTEHLLCVFPRFLLQLTGLRKQIYDSSVLVWIGVKIKLWPAFSRGRGRLEDFLWWVVSTFLLVLEERRCNDWEV